MYQMSVSAPIYNMDLLFMRKIAGDKDFVRNLFLKGEQTAAKGYDRADFSVEKVTHSVMTEDGESDVEAVLSIEGKKIALLIEDKIDAIAMQEQAARYTIRGEKAVQRGEYDEFYVFIIAPENYLNSNSEAKKYAHRIPYQEVLRVLDA